MSCSKKQYFKAAIFIAATSLFLLQASTQIKRYIGHETTFASEYKLFDNYEFPALAVCYEFGYNEMKMKKMGMNNKYFWTDIMQGKEDLSSNYSFPKNNSEFDIWWNSSTFQIEDYLL